MRVAVVGLGRMGRFYAQTVASGSLGPDIQLAAVADPDPVARAAVKRELGVPIAAAEPADIFARADIDAVIIATPTSTHAELVVAAAQAGKAIFCESPWRSHSSRRTRRWRPCNTLACCCKSASCAGSTRRTSRPAP